MRRWGRTGFAAVLTLIWLMASMAAAASPGGAPVSATLRFALDPGEVMAQPFDRWLRELAGMTALTIESGAWKGGEAMRLTTRMVGREAWRVSLLEDGAGVSVESSLMAEGAVLLREADAAEARALMAAFRAAAAGPAAQTLTAEEFAALVRGAARTMARWGEAAKGTEGETCSAIADFLNALADIAGGAGEAVWLTITVERGESAAPPVSPGARLAPEELPGVLAMEGFWAVMRAIATG